MSALVALVDAIVADLTANVTLPAQGSPPWRYVAPRHDNPDQMPALAVWTDGASYGLVSTPNTYRRRWTVSVDWLIAEFAGTEFGGSGDAAAVTALEPIVEALAARVSQYRPLGGIPGYTGVTGPASAEGILIGHTTEAVAGAVYRGRVELEVTEEVDL